MTLQDLLTTAERAGIRLEARGDRLTYQAPKGALTPELREALTQHKAALIERLRPMEFVTLKGGLTIPVPALQLALDLEAREIPLATDADHHFVVPDDPRLTNEDRAAIHRWRLHLGAIVQYRVPEVA